MEGSIGESVTRAALVELFPNHPFEKTRRVQGLNGLELDCYNADLCLAVEYQGIQHYEYVPIFCDGDPARFEAQKARDELKRQCCKQVGIALLEIPYTVPTIHIRTHLRELVVGLEYDVPEYTTTDDEFFAKVATNGTHVLAMLTLAQDIAHRHGGVCRSTTYINCRTPLQFVCALGHEFAAPLANVNQPEYRGPRFCPECGGTRRRTDDENRAAVESAGYAFIEERVRITGGTPPRHLVELVVRCPAGHEYAVLRENFVPVTNGIPKRGCIRCARKRTNGARGLEERKRNALEFGLELVGPYVDQRAPSAWRCTRCGHEFESSWVAVRSSVRTRRVDACPKCR